MSKLILSYVILLIFPFTLIAQETEPDQVYYANVQQVKLFPLGNPLGYPILRLGSGDQLELHFDDREGGVKNYSYTWQLCNADWTPANLNAIDYIKGFTQQRISNYRNSSIALTKYTHYQAQLPDRSAMPSRSGNFLLRVFLNGDPNQLVFTRRVLVVDAKAAVGVQVQQPFNNQLFTTHQKIVFTVNMQQLNLMNPMQQVQVVLLQNYRWDNAKKNFKPTFVRQNQLEYNTEQDAVFPATKEWRWLDLRSFRLQSERVDSASYSPSGTDVYVKTDMDRSGLRTIYYRDGNGIYYNEALDGVNPYWQGDYATVHFSYRPAGGMQFSQDLYLFGELTNYGRDPQAKMVYNKTRGVYETSMWLKQGYYDYAYALKAGTAQAPVFDTDKTEGNYWETENNYLVLVYYRSLGGRADELVAIGKVNSLGGRLGQ